MEYLSTLVKNMNESATIKMAALSRELQEKGEDVISLSVGEPDFNTSEHIKEAGIKAIKENYSHYPPVNGFKELRQAVCQHYKETYKADYRDTQVVVSNGAKQSLANLFFALLNEGDEVILPTPFWVSYAEMIKMTGAKVVEVPTGVDQDYKVNISQLDAAVTDRSKLILICNPSNPTGSVYSPDELDELASWLAKHPNLFIVSDEIYEHIIFEGPYKSFCTDSDLADRTAIVSGVSKAYAMTGWRIGYAIAPNWLSKACTKIQGQFTSGANAMAQMASVEAILGPQNETTRMTEVFKKRKSLVLDKLSTLKWIKFNNPKGAFYLFPEIKNYFGHNIGSKVVENSEEFCMAILETAKVALVPGQAFGAPDCMRISFATSEENLSESMDRIVAVLKNVENNA